MKKELILEIIQSRWSPYAFSRQPIEEFKIKAMFEAAGHAPSCCNEQPWMFAFATCDEEKAFNDYLDFLDDEDKAWAKNAYMLIMAFARKTFSANGQLNRFALYDTGMAVANMALQAVTFDIYVHQVGSFSTEKVTKYFNYNDNIEAITIMAAGYLGDGSDIPANILQKDETKRLRKQVNEYAFRNKLYNPAF